MVGFGVRAITDVDQLESTVTVNVWLRQKWYDTRLAWNPKNPHEFQGNLIILPTDVVWVPDFWLYNTGEKPMSNLAMTHAEVYSNGLVNWSR